MFEGNREHDYRQVTDRNASTMIGVSTQFTFICKRCRTCQPIKGRKRMVEGYDRYGFACAGCVEKRRNIQLNDVR